MVLGADMALSSNTADDAAAQFETLILSGFNVIAAPAAVQEDGSAPFGDLLQLGSQHGVYAVAAPPPSDARPMSAAHHK
jgi:hypothetical protein